MRYVLGAGVLIFLLVGLVVGCSRDLNPVAMEPVSDRGVTLATATATTPPGLETVDAWGRPLTFWPYTGENFFGLPQDPVNLIFLGHADPRAIRAALMSLDGDRTGFGMPDEFPFNCTWQDAIGGMQTAYGEPTGWVGNGVQLECGNYQSLRFHLRLFRVGDWTIGSAHFDMIIPGTTDHQVISWEIPEQLVKVDLLRSGLVDPGQPFLETGAIHASPFRGIPAVIYNGMPVELRALIGGPLGDVTDSVGIFTDGRATVLNLVDSVPFQPGVETQEFVIDFNQVIPKPFCASGPFDYLWVQGPVSLRQRTVLSPAGNLVSQFHARGHLELTPVNPLTSPPTAIGDTYTALVNERHKAIVTSGHTQVSSMLMQLEIPPDGPYRGKLLVQLNVGPEQVTDYRVEMDCLP